MSLRARKLSPPSDSKLNTVLQRLGVTRIDHDFEAAADEDFAASGADASSPGIAMPALKLHRPDDETAIKFTDAKQLQQMGRHLIRWRTELQRQQTQLQSEQRHWTQQMQLEHKLIADHKTRLDSRQRHIKSTEFQLMQLQNDVIDAQVALQRTVESLTRCQSGDDRDGNIVAELTTLRFELYQRFDYVVTRWAQLRSQIQSTN